MVCQMKPPMPASTISESVNQLGISIEGYCPTNVLVDKLCSMVMEFADGLTDCLWTTPEMKGKFILVIPNTNTTRFLSDLLKITSISANQLACPLLNLIEIGMEL